MFEIKICGITNVEDALLSADAGADAIGLNFFRGSKRYVDVDVARQICDAVGGRVLRVGVFVNSSTDDIMTTANYAGLDAVQLHGDERPHEVSELEQVLVIKAFRCREGCLEPVQEFLRQSKSIGAAPSSILLDAYHPTHFGGTGERLNLANIANQIRQIECDHWGLAGGLNPDNVAEAIRTIHPKAVDVASGVEQNARKKDQEKILAFVVAAKRAFETFT